MGRPFRSFSQAVKTLIAHAVALSVLLSTISSSLAFTSVVGVLAKWLLCLMLGHVYKVRVALEIVLRVL